MRRILAFKVRSEYLMYSMPLVLLSILTLTICAPARAEAPKPPMESHYSTKLIPLPIYSTLPNEGSTFGFMPVIMKVEDKTQFTRSITAPSYSWNKIIKHTATFRLFYYPNAESSLTFIPSVSTHVNRNVSFYYVRNPAGAGEWSDEFDFNAERSIFARFFGIGSDSKEANETSFTRNALKAKYRHGYNLTDQLNIGAELRFNRHLVERINVDFLPLMTQRFPGTPGIGGSSLLQQNVSLRYDSRPERQYSKFGYSAEVAAGISEGLSGIDGPLGHFLFEAKALWVETDNIYGGARLYTGYTAGRNIPFLLQQSLGGSFLLRGFTEDRFIDKGAWELELEQRITLFQTQIYGVVADWRLDPFVAVGQVYNGIEDLVGHTRVSGGVGFRAFVNPNVLGRVDMAFAGEGIKIYVELGYPF